MEDQTNKGEEAEKKAGGQMGLERRYLTWREREEARYYIIGRIFEGIDKKEKKKGRKKETGQWSAKGRDK